MPRPYCPAYCSSLPFSPSPSHPPDIIDSVRFWLPPRHPFMHTFPAIWQTAWRRGYDRPRWYARCHLGFSCNYELRDERALRGREASKPSDKPQLNYVRGSPCRRKEIYGEGSKKRERDFILRGKEPFMIGVSRIKWEEEDEFGCIGCRKGKVVYQGRLIGSNYGANLWWNLIKHSNSDL